MGKVRGRGRFPNRSLLSLYTRDTIRNTWKRWESLAGLVEEVVLVGL